MLLRINEILSDPLGFLISFLMMLPGACLAISIHESAHGWVAEKCGDPTARYQGRITLNPLKHFDPIGFICMLFVGFGWAKPVPVNPLLFKNYRKDDIKVSLAGITANLCLFLVCVIVIATIFTVSVAVAPTYEGGVTYYRENGEYVEVLYVYTDKAELGSRFKVNTDYGTFYFCRGGDSWQYIDSDVNITTRVISTQNGGNVLLIDYSDEYVFGSDEIGYVSQYFYAYMFDAEYSAVLFGKVLSILVRMLVYCMFINMSLAVFNLIPLPPLDGYHVLNDLVLKQDLFAQRRTQQICSMILLGLIMIGNVKPEWDVISIVINWVEKTVLGGIGSLLKSFVGAIGVF